MKLPVFVTLVSFWSSRLGAGSVVGICCSEALLGCRPPVFSHHEGPLSYGPTESSGRKCSPTMCPGEGGWAVFVASLVLTPRLREPPPPLLFHSRVVLSVVASCIRLVCLAVFPCGGGCVPCPSVSHTTGPLRRGLCKTPWVRTLHLVCAFGFFNAILLCQKCFQVP